MTTHIGTFLVAFAISALGSFPPGSISMLTIRTAIVEGKLAAYRFVLIAAIMEVPHILIALLFYSYISKNQIFETWFEYATIVFLLLLGVVSILKRRTPSQLPIPTKNSLQEAILVNFFNPFSIPFWVFFSAYMINEGWINKDFSPVAFCAGATLGAVLSLGSYAILGNIIERKKVFDKINVDFWLGVAFILLAGYKILSLAVKNS